MSTRTRLIHLLVAAPLLIGGSVIFVLGGKNHPRIGSAMGTIGSQQFFEAFAHHMVETPNWIGIHTLILLGPVLWALGVAATTIESEKALWRVGQSAILLAAASWIVAFVLDGYVGPVWAQMVLAADGPGRALLIAGFRASQQMMVSLGLFGIVLTGAAMMALGGALLTQARAAATRHLGALMLGGTGVLIGVWPLVAWGTGEFLPGPFTSSLWNETALMISAWFIGLGAFVMLAGRDPTTPALDE